MSSFDSKRAREVCARLNSDIDPETWVSERFETARDIFAASGMLPAALNKINEIGASLIVANGIISDQAEHIHELSAILEETRSMQVDHNRALEEQHEKDLRVQAKHIQELAQALIEERATAIQCMVASPDHPERMNLARQEAHEQLQKEGLL